MKALVFGASGATGKLLVDQLIKKNCKVKIIVRPTSVLPESWAENDSIEIIRAQLHEMSPAELASYLTDCQAVASCLGHNLSWKGIYGKPRKLVTDAMKLTTKAIAINSSEQPIKIVLMNTAGNRNRDLKEPISIGQRLVISLLRVLLPPHPDNEQAADHLRVEIGQSNSKMEWVVVRPDTLIDHDSVSSYELHPSPSRSAIFNPGKTSRINVGHFMADLITSEGSWHQWKGQMPIIYNREESS